MILTTCAACAAPLAHTAPRCVRCHTRYCNKTCQHDHWRRGHKQICKKIHRGGNAEQYYADKKYKEAVAVAVEACAEDTTGQTCYICAGNSPNNDMLRMCACQGTAGFVHLSCLAEQAKILLDEAEANNLGDKVFNERWRRWDTCSLCEQMYHGVVCCALGWACWKTYGGRPETDETRRMAMNLLGSSLNDAGHHEDALSVQEAELSTMRRLGTSERSILIAQGNLANTYQTLGRTEALNMYRDVYSGWLKFNGAEDGETLVAANNYADSLANCERFEEAKALLRRTMPVARRVLGEGHRLTLKMRWNYAHSLCMDPAATLDDLRESVTALENTEQTARRVLGGTHPVTVAIERDLRNARAALRLGPRPPPPRSA